MGVLRARKQISDVLRRKRSRLGNGPGSIHGVAARTGWAQPGWHGSAQLGSACQLGSAGPGLAQLGARVGLACPNSAQLSSSQLGPAQLGWTLLLLIPPSLVGLRLAWFGPGFVLHIFQELLFFVRPAVPFS